MSSTSNKIDSLFADIFGSSDIPRQKSVTITKLDNGYLLTANGKQSAFSTFREASEAAEKVFK